MNASSGDEWAALPSRRRSSLRRRFVVAITILVAIEITALSLVLGLSSRRRLRSEIETGARKATLDVNHDCGTESYLMPLSSLWGEEHLGHGATHLSATLAKLRRGPKVGVMIDGTSDAEMSGEMLEMLRRDQSLDAADGRIVFHGSDRLRAIEEVGDPRLLGIEQSNASIAFGNEIILKLYRRLREGTQPDIEMARFLTRSIVSGLARFWCWFSPASIRSSAACGP